MALLKGYQFLDSEGNPVSYGVIDEILCEGVVSPTRYSENFLTAVEMGLLMLAREPAGSIVTETIFKEYFPAFQNWSGLKDSAYELFRNVLCGQFSFRKV